MPFIFENVRVIRSLLGLHQQMTRRIAKNKKYKSNTSLKDVIASITSFVNVLPAPDDPIKTVGLIAWQSTTS